MAATARRGHHARIVITTIIMVAAVMVGTIMVHANTQKRKLLQTGEASFFIAEDYLGLTRQS